MAPRRLQVGQVEIWDLTDAAGPFPASLSSLFPGVAPAQWQPFRERYPTAFAGDDGVHFHFGGFLLRSQGRTLLVDTGVGPAPAPAVFGDLKGQLLMELRALDLRPEDIDIVFTTHAHIDHVGWNLTAAHTPTFPRARYLMHQADWDALPQLQAAMPPYVDQTITPLRTLGKLELLTGETPLTDEVIALPTPGHTPGHMSLLIVSGEERALVMGDVVVHPAQVSEPDWVFSGDFDAALAVDTRRQYLDRVEAGGMTMLQCHFPSPGYGRIVRLDGRRYWQGA